MDRATAEFIQTTTGTNFAIEEDEEVIDVCRAWKNSMDQAKSEGLLAGREEGLLAGRAEGREQMANETAIEMLKAKLSVEMIARITKLTVENIVEIGKKNALI